MGSENRRRHSRTWVRRIALAATDRSAANRVACDRFIAAGNAPRVPRQGFGRGEGMKQFATCPRGTRSRWLTPLALILAVEVLVNGTGCQRLELTKMFPNPWGSKEDD